MTTKYHQAIHLEKLNLIITAKENNMKHEDTLEKLCKTLKFSEDEAKFFQLLMSRDISKDKEFFESFLSQRIGDQTFNKKILSLIEEGKKEKPKFLLPTIFYELAKITYKTRDINDFEKVLTKISDIKKLEENNISIPEDKKLTLFDISVLNSMSEVRTLLSSFQFKDSFVIKHKDSEIKLSALVENDIILSITKFDMSFIKAGDIIAHNPEYQKLIKGKLHLAEKVKSNLLDFIHLSLAKSSEKPEQTHIWGNELRSGSITHRETLYSEIFRLNISKLISQDMKTKLNAKYGDNWEKIIQKKYETQLQSILSKPYKISLTSLKKSAKDIVKGSFTSAFAKKTTPIKLSPELEKEMMCSEFIGVAIFNACDELNEDLQKELATTEKIIKNPVASQKTLNQLTTDGLIKVLKKNGAIEKVEHPLAKYCRSDKKYLSTFSRTIGNIDMLLVEIKKSLKDSKNEEEFVKNAKNLFTAYLSDLTEDQKNKLDNKQVSKQFEEKISSLYKSKKNKHNFVLKFLNYIESSIKGIFSVSKELKTVLECVNIMKNDISDAEYEYKSQQEALELARNYVTNPKDEKNEISSDNKKLSNDQFRFLYTVILPNRVEHDIDKIKTAVIDELNKENQKQANLTKLTEKGIITKLMKKHDISLTTDPKDGKSSKDRSKKQRDLSSTKPTASRY
jgi:hypothetical protein